MTSSTICSHHRIRTVLLMCVVLLSSSLHAPAQNKETRINLNIRNATLESFVKQLENATGFSFIYGEEVKLTHRITLEMKQRTSVRYCNVPLKTNPSRSKYPESTFYSISGPCRRNPLAVSSPSADT